MKLQTILETLDPELMERIVSRRDALRGAGKWGRDLALASVPLALAATATDAFAAHPDLTPEIVEVLNFALTLEHLEAEFYNIGLTGSPTPPPFGVGPIQFTRLIPANLRPVFLQIAKHENAHVKLLQAVLGPQAKPKPEFDFTGGGRFPDVFSNFRTFATLAQGFEDTGVRAYKGQAPKLMPSDFLLTVALQIHSVEARHAAQVRRLEASPADKAFITLNRTDVPALQPVYAGEEQITQLGVNVANVLPDFVQNKEEVASRAFDEPLTMEQVLAIVRPFIKG
jgi:rubrerythrin